jgi:hypothetical protein
LTHHHHHTLQGYIDYDSGEERFDGINATLAAGVSPVKLVYWASLVADPSGQSI